MHPSIRDIIQGPGKNLIVASVERRGPRQLALSLSLSLSPFLPSSLPPPPPSWVAQGRRGKTSSDLTFFSILRAAGESGVKRIFPINRGFAALHAILVRGLDSRLWINALQKVAARKEGTDFIETPVARTKHGH